MAFSLKAILGLETSSFERGLDKSRKKLNGAVSGMMRGLGPLVGFAGFSVLTNNALNLAREVDNLSRLIGVNGDDFQKLAFATKSVNIQQEKMADIFKDTSDKIGDFMQNEAGPLKDFFDNIAPQVGVTADQFANLSGPQALQLYYSSLEKANLSQSDMTFYMEAIASDATLLSPLLANNGEMFKKLGEEAEAAGLILSKMERDELAKTNKQLDAMSGRGTILAGKVLPKLIGILNIAKNGILFLGEAIGVGASNIISFGKALGTVTSAVIQPAISVIESLLLSIKAMGLAVTRDFEGAAEAARAAKDAFAEISGEITDIPDAMSRATAQLAREVSAGAEFMGESISKKSKQITADLDTILGKSKEIAGIGGPDKTDKEAAADRARIRNASELNKMLKRRKELEEEILRGQEKPKKIKGGEKTGFDIERAEDESIMDFQKRQAGAGEAKSKLDLLQSQYMAGAQIKPSDALKAAARGDQEALDTLAEAEKQTKELTTLNTSIKVIQNELTGTGGAT